MSFVAGGVTGGAYPSFAGTGGATQSQPYPATLSGLLAWYRADLGVTLSSSKVTQWSDLSGNGKHLTATGALMPTYQPASSAFGGSSLVFSGAQKLVCATLTMSQPNTIIWIGRMSALTGNPGFFDDATIRQIGYVASGPAYAMDAGSGLVAGTPDTLRHAHAFVFNGASSHLYVDSTTNPIISGNPGANAGTGGFIVGTQSTGFMTGEISEVAVFNRALSTTEISNFFSYASGNRPTSTPLPTLAFDGNSIVYGDLASPLSKGFAPLAAAAFGPNLNYVNSGLEGAATPLVITQSALFTDPQYSPLRPRNVVVMNEVVNDYNTNGNSTATCIANLRAYVAAKRATGWDRIGIFTCLPNYIINETDRAIINTAIRSGATGADGVIDWAADPIVGDHANITNTAIFADQLHLTTFGHSIPVPRVVSDIKALWS